MNETGRDFEIGRNVRMIEWLKTELVSGLAQIYKEMPKGRDEAIASALARVMMYCYLLGKRLNISFAKLEATVERKARLHAEEGHELEEWYQDLSTLMAHLEARRTK
ncbi:MAG: MazG-like family protein [Firmicutes bacterium]|nr:MazG-like family protein [Dethiobacter sp.]MBS3888860.1 MazG-like family protein [Bacillota bacterium]MBS4054935.1 MazG-like family protein [Thermaerobacter sp.]